MVLLDQDTFRKEFTILTKGFTWQVEQVFTRDGLVLPPSKDSKEISKLLERQAEHVVRRIAADYGYEFEVSNHQNYYPDATLSLYNQGVLVHRIAIDAKSTFERPKGMKFTLGSYTSYLVDGKKNILHSYDSYSEHWVLAFVYSRIDDPVYGYDEVRWFINDKHLLSGLVAGSGNTANIGSVTFGKDQIGTSVGPFGSFEFAKGACDYYWRNYARLRKEIRTASDLFAHPEFSDFNPMAEA